MIIDEQRIFPELGEQVYHSDPMLRQLSAYPAELKTHGRLQISDPTLSVDCF